MGFARIYLYFIGAISLVFGVIFLLAPETMTDHGRLRPLGRIRCPSGHLALVLVALSIGAVALSRAGRRHCSGAGGFTRPNPTQRDFEFATLVFEGPTLEREDNRRDYGEKRVVAIGLENRTHRRLHRSG
jgi:hypothetical protein